MEYLFIGIGLLILFFIFVKIDVKVDKETSDSIPMKSTKDKIEIVIEKSNDVWLVYNKTTSKFIAQGTNDKELLANIKINLNGDNFFITKENMDVAIMEGLYGTK